MTEELIGCAECGADGGHALYCVACAEKYVSKGTRMTEEIDPIKAIDFIARESKNYAQAYADANHLERFLKTIKSQLMNDEAGTLGAKEAYAYAHPKYVEMLEALKTAEMNKEHLKYMLDAAKLKVEVWKVLEYNRRVEIKNQM